MGHRCCTKQKVKRGLWSPEEDEKLVNHIAQHGHVSWSSVPKLAGLQRCGKSCRLRWINYLRPDLKRGSFTSDEEQIIIDVHRILGNKWAQIAKHLPGRTDNEVKNFWNSCIKKKLLSQGLDPKTHNLLSSHKRANRITTSNTNSSSSQIMKEQTFSVFNGNSHPMEITAPPLFTHPPTTTPSQPPPHDILTPNYDQYQNPNNSHWTGNIDQNSNESSTNMFPYDLSMENSLIYSLSSTLSGFNIMDETHCNNMSANISLDTCGAIQQVTEEGREMQNQEKEKNSYDDIHDMMIHEMDGSLDSTSFDLGFVESTLMSGAMCRDNLNSMDDYNYAWNF